MYLRLLALFAAGSLFAQDATIRVDVQQVLVPVVVTDKKGRHVTGLHASDFRLLEDGQQQEIASFSTDASAAAADLGAAAPKQAGPRRTFVICLDTLHASQGDAERTRDALKELFETQKPTDAQYVLIGIGRELQVLEPATTNPLAILVKVRAGGFSNRIGSMDAGALAAQVRNVRVRMEEFCRRCACNTRSSKTNCDSEVDSLKQAVDAEADRWTTANRALLEQFKSVVEELAKLPTARTLILVSDGFTVNPRHEFYSAVTDYLPNQTQLKVDESVAADPILRQALQVAAERAVIIDAIDTHGNAAPSFASSGSMDASASSGTDGGISMIGTNRPARQSPAAIPAVSDADSQARRSRSEENSAMEQLTHATGGLYFHPGADLLKQFRGAFAEGREYYLLSYVPKNSAHDGKFHAITVEVADKKLTVRAKPGYWAPGTAQ